MSTLVCSCSPPLVPFLRGFFWTVLLFLYSFVQSVSVVQLIIHGFVLYKLKPFFCCCFELPSGRCKSCISFEGRPRGGEEEVVVPQAGHDLLYLSHGAALMAAGRRWGCAAPPALVSPPALSRSQPTSP